jgi:hypothetical protein
MPVLSTEPTALPPYRLTAYFSSPFAIVCSCMLLVPS